VGQVQELIYGKQLSLSAIQTAAHSLERIRRGVVRQSARELDVKNGAGGLREIEFVVQCLQRVHGGGEPWLRSSGTLFALQKLHDKGNIGDAEFRELGATYGLLRAIEHRLQCRQGAQSHRLPEAQHAQVALFRSLGEGSIAGAEELRRTMQSASALCGRVLRLGSAEASGEVTATAVSLGAPGAERLRRELAARSEALASALAAEVGDPTLGNLQRFLAAASTGEERIRATLENAEWIERALPVFARSTLAKNILARHPEDIFALFQGWEPGGGSSISDQLRIEARRCILRLVGRTFLEKMPVWEILREHSRGFDLILRQALRATEAPEGFAVLAVGRLGTCELDVVSDADLVFLRSAECDSEAAERCAHSLVAMLSGYTREGSVIAVDTRIRPHGSEGELVVSSRQLAQYFECDAKPWEMLAFGKLRYIAGAERLAEDATRSLHGLQKRLSASKQLVPELRAMRKRMADSGGADNFKTGAGGLYDIDFLVGMLEARAGLPAAGNQLSIRLEALISREILPTPQGGDLLHAADLFRRVDHANRAVEGRSRKWLPKSDVLRANLENIVESPDLDGALHAEMRRVRAIFDGFFHD
jgi:glutamate-ammonia-ligase adenylyltransferase